MSYTFRSVATRTADGLVTDADAAVVGTLHACFGPLPDDSASFNFYAEGTLGKVAFMGRGNCLSTRADYPEQGLNGFRCYLNRFGAATDPPGYVQASIATVRLWKRRP